MPTQRLRHFLLSIAILASVPCFADMIRFSSGSDIECRVLSYSNGVFWVEMPDGAVKGARAASITQIQFGPTTAPMSFAPSLVLTAKQKTLQPSGIDKESLALFKSEQKTLLLGVSLTLMNKSTNSATVGYKNFSLKDADGIVYSTSFLGATMTGGIEEFALAPQQTHGCWMLFQIPVGTDISKLQVRCEADGMRSDWTKIP